MGPERSGSAMQGARRWENVSGAQAEQAQSSKTDPTNLPGATLVPLGSARIYFLRALLPVGTSGDIAPCPSDSLNVFNGTSRLKESGDSV